MPDVHRPQTRSYNMSRIRSRDTRPEMLLRSWLFSRGLRYRLHDKKLPGKPDLVLTKYKTAIFVHGCFWHGHDGCKNFKVPKTRTEWWIEKIKKNGERDQKAVAALIAGGWKVKIIFECKLKKPFFEQTLEELILEFYANDN